MRRSISRKNSRDPASNGIGSSTSYDIGLRFHHSRTCCWVVTRANLEEFPGPELDAERAPELEACGSRAGAVAREAPARRVGVDEAALGEHPRRENLLGDLAEAAPQPRRLGGDEAE